MPKFEVSLQVAAIVTVEAETEDQARSEAERFVEEYCSPTEAGIDGWNSATDGCQIAGAEHLRVSDVISVDEAD